MGPRTPDPPLFEILAELFVTGMGRAFPNGSLDCRSFDADHGAYGPAELDAAFGRRRDEYRARWDALVAAEDDARIELCPRIERGAGTGVLYFNQWLERTEHVNLERLLELHVDLPRFTSGRVMPLIERDAGGAFLDSVFPWSSFGRAVDDDAPGEGGDAVEEDDGELLADDEDEADTIEGSRELGTSYWATPRVAAHVILGGGA